MLLEALLLLFTPAPILAPVLERVSTPIVAEDAAESPSTTADLKGGSGDCPDFSVQCPMVYDPVICSDGNVYFNQCVAIYWGCAGDCESWIPDLSLSTGYPIPGPHGNPCHGYDVLCPAVYDPVICADGIVYPNECVAIHYGCTGDCIPLYETE